MNCEEYLSDLISELRADAAVNQTDTADEFYSRSIEILADNGDLVDPILFYFGKNGRRNRYMQIDGYCFDELEKSMTLFIFDFEDSINPSNLINTQIDVLYKRLRNFLDEVCHGDISDYCDASDEVNELAALIKKRMQAGELDNDEILKIKFFIISNKQLSSQVKKVKQEQFDNRPVELNIWHLERFYELELANDNEPIFIDFKKDFDSEGIPCIKGDIGKDLGYEAYIAIIPGRLLADIYIEYGSKILEGNIRAFLGAGNAKSVNNGIKRTIINEPSRFFTYNNGIATTASKIELDTKDNQMYITAIEDLQIINGGQTTASLAEAVLKKTNQELEGIFVPMKLTVIEDRDTVEDDGIRFYDSMVEKIARYANKQNSTTEADFFSNSPYHVLMEQMSKRFLAPPVNGNLNPTGWYYERTKKKYNQEQMKMTPSEKKKFALKYPKKQLIKKEDWAKYLYCIEQKPDVVSRGRNYIIKNFGPEINEQYKTNKDDFNEYYFKKGVASAIVFKTVDGYLDKLKRTPDAWYKVGGYKLNIVPYSIAKLMYCIPSGYSIDWMRIWKEQSLYKEFMYEIEKMTKVTNDFICDSHGVIVTEYCKKHETWEAYKKVPYELSEDFIATLVPLDVIKEQSTDAKKEQKENNSIKDALAISQMGSYYWKQLLDEGMKNNLLSFKDISLLRVAIDIETTGKLPSTLQTKAILRIKKKIEDAGVIIK